MSKIASVTNLERRIKQREAKRFRDKFYRLLMREHVRSGLEILVQYESSRGMDEMLYVVPRLAVSEAHVAQLLELGWKLDGGRWCADYEPFCGVRS